MGRFMECALKKEGGLWNRWEVLAMGISQSQPRMRLHQIFLQSLNHRKGTSPLIFGPCRACVFAACLTGAREACLHPRIPHWHRVYPKHRASFHIFTPTNRLPTHPLLYRTPAPPPPHRLGPPVPAGLSSALKSFHKANYQSVCCST
jgi:hypothetical protein